MNASRTLFLTDIREDAIDRVPSENAKTPLRAHKRSRLALRRIIDVSRVKRDSEQQASKRAASINTARYGRELNGAEVTERTRV
jgi:hypothetical protein